MGLDHEQLYAAVERRDRAFDGAFVFAVRTTSVFCRPGCAARTPRRDNVLFFADASAAQSAGFRACRRCRPLEAPGVAPDWIRGLFVQIERTGAPLTARQMRAAGVHPARASRWFQEHMGMSFRAFQHSLRLGASIDALRAGASVGDAAAAARFESESGFREAFARALGHAPSRLPASARSVRLARLATVLGDVLIGACDEGVCLLEFLDRDTLPGQLAALRKALGPALSLGDHPLLARATTQLQSYFAGEQREFDLPLLAPGTDFEQRVWAELRRIPYGRTLSYAQLATQIGRPTATRAVAGANSRNRIAVIIPCHRVIAADGGLGGYAGSVWRKERLLELEGAR
jgi:AraC family transcriptional regulator of adaptative response/methylated-DNA-[protein]-cysteine methyltransferase